MKPAPFVYHAPRELQEALDLLAEHGHEGKVLAGGQSLVPVLNMRLAAPAHLVDINRLPDLDRVEVTDEEVRVGALVRHADLLADDAAHEAQPLLRQALEHVAHPVIRNRGTVVGSLAHADPSGEMPAILAITDGAVQLRSGDGGREVPWHEFFVAPMESAVAPEELAVGATFGRFPAGTRTAFTETARRHGDYAVAGTALALRVEDGRAILARASYVSVTEVPSVLDLLPVLEGHDLAGGTADDALLEAVGTAVAGFVDPGDDIHATADYRRHLAVVQTRRLLADLLGGPTVSPVGRKERNR